jgi:glycosyltransferase involved in cell wall biosynthesis
MRIAIFDHVFRRNNPIGSCQRRVASALAAEHEITVFAAASDIAPEDRLRFVPVPVPRRPLVLLYVAYHLMALAKLALARLRGESFDLIQSSDSYFFLARVRYLHFCHRAFLKLEPSPNNFHTLRGWFNWLDHLVQAAIEPFAFRRAHTIVACSRVLAREVVREYPFCKDKIRLIPNAIDVERMRRPAEFDRSAVRASLGFEGADVVLAFVALGHFERKGLPILIDAVARARDRRIKLLLVGGEESALAPYRKRATDRGVDGQVLFLGRQADVRPMLWAADAFAFPSHYEAFPLAGLEAAAAGLPLIAPAINGIEEMLIDGENGYTVRQTADSVAAAIVKFVALGSSERQRMGAAARRAVEPFNLERFAREWRDLIQLLSSRAPERKIEVHVH